MIRQTFLHLPGIGTATERRMWGQGVLDWDGVLNTLPSSMPDDRRQVVVKEVADSKEAIERLDGRYFAARLQSKHQWRLYPDFQTSVAFFDIETTGLDARRDELTTIAMYDGQQIRTYVQGENLEDFATDIASYQLLVTYNGRCFDVPFVEAKFPGLKLDQAHIDLRYLLAALGYKGGLKGSEKKMGIARPEGLTDVDGFLAVKLWHAHMNGDARALPALLRYNVEDAINLRWLMETACNKMIGRLPITVEPVVVADRPDVAMPFDPSIIDRLAF